MAIGVIRRNGIIVGEDILPTIGASEFKEPPLVYEQSVNKSGGR